MITQMSYAQQMSVKGTVYDTTGTKPLYNALAMAVRVRDSVLLDFTRTDKNGKFEITGFEVDTFSLMANYRDPFLGKIATRKVKSNKAPSNPRIRVAPKRPKAKTNWPKLAYNGLIKKQASNETLALIQINGKSAIMKIGETLDKVKLLKIYPDSIKVKFEGLTKHVRK